MENFIELTSSLYGFKSYFNPNSIEGIYETEKGSQLNMIGHEAFLCVTETPAEIDAKISELKKRNSTPSQTDSLIVANLRAHLDELRKDYTSNEDGSIEYLKKLTSKISLLEEILSLQKPV